MTGNQAKTSTKELATIITASSVGTIIEWFLISKSSMSVNAWEGWGWRIPFLASALMVIISMWIRKNMKESPLFAKPKLKGKHLPTP